MPKRNQAQPAPKRFIRRLREEMEALHAHNIMKFGASCPDDEAFLVEWKLARAAAELAASKPIADPGPEPEDAGKSGPEAQTAPSCRQHLQRKKT